MIKTIDVDSMTAGREFDHLVATKVMGWKGLQPGYGPMGFNYSTNISDAWQLLIKFESYFLMGVDEELGPHECFQCQVVPKEKTGDRTMYAATAHSMPEAICRAALKAVMNENKNPKNTQDQKL